MATHSSIPAWESPRREEPGWLQSMQSQKVRQNGACAHAHPIIQGKMPLFSLTISYPFYLFSFDLTHEQMREPVYVLEKLVLRRI